jgi:MFS family permease
MSSAKPHPSLWWLFAGTIVLSAFLLFLVQPLIAKVLLPWFGGTSAVWAFCVVFFQVMLCAGYGYAHAIRRWLNPKQQMFTHLGVLCVAALMLWIIPSDRWEPTDGSSPIGQLAFLLFWSVGIPYFTLSTTGPLLQSWFADAYPDSTPYRLYALSNFGSLLSLLLFPFTLEPWLGLFWLGIGWSTLFFVFLVTCSIVTIQYGQMKQAQAATPTAEPVKVNKAKPTDEPTITTTTSDRVLWFLLPAFASFMLLAGTNHITQDLPSLPFMWVLPLSLYLLSFIICFDYENWYIRPLFAIMAMVGLYFCAGMYKIDHAVIAKGEVMRGTWPVTGPFFDALGWRDNAKLPLERADNWQTWLAETVELPKVNLELGAEIVMHVLALFGLFMIFHGELVRRKPAAQHLTGFYLAVSIGGALGGAFVSLIAPLIFTSNTEWLLGIVICLLLCGGLLLDQPPDRWYPLRFIFTAVPALLIVSKIFWQNSELPADIVSWADPAAYEIYLTERHPDSKSLFSSSTVILVWIACVVLFALGILAMNASFKINEKLRFWVVNLSVLFLVCFVVYDVMEFLEVTKAITQITSATKPTAKVDPDNQTTIAAAQLFQLQSKLKAQEIDESNIALEREREQLLNFMIREKYQDDVQAKGDLDLTNYTVRNFYGSLRVYDWLDYDYPQNSYRGLVHGRISHGKQFLDLRAPEDQADPASGPDRLPVSYYAPDSGVGLAIGHFRRGDNSKMRIGAIGLGTGTVAAYGMGPGHDFVFYEINELVKDLSDGENPRFTYISDARKLGCKVDVVLGDARLKLKQEATAGIKREFDVLVVDAFSGDSIPTHLLTKEALDIYRSQMRADGRGILAIHISNRYISLEPVCRGLAIYGQLMSRIIKVKDRRSELVDSSTWILLTAKNQEFFDIDCQAVGTKNNIPLFPSSLSRLAVEWTDDYSNVFDILKVNYDETDD